MKREIITTIVFTGCNVSLNKIKGGAQRDLECWTQADDPGEVKPEGKENQAKSPGPKDKLGWANQTKKEGLSESAEVVKKQ